MGNSKDPGLIRWRPKAMRREHRALLAMLPRYVKGARQGLVRGGQFQEFERLLSLYRFSKVELRLIKADIRQAVVDHSKRVMAFNSRRRVNG